MLFRLKNKLLNYPFFFNQTIRMYVEQIGACIRDTFMHTSLQLSLIQDR